MDIFSPCGALESLSKKIATEANIKVDADQTVQLLAYTGTSVAINMFLDSVLGISSVMNMLPFQLLQLRQDLNEINKKVTILNKGKSKTALDYFKREEYAKAKELSMEGFQNASDIETKVIATRIKIISSVILIAKKIKNKKEDLKKESGKIIKMCIDELMEDPMVSNCWNQVRRFRVLPKLIINHLNPKKDLEMINSLLAGFYPAMSHSLSWTQKALVLDSARNQTKKNLIYTKYIPQGKSNRVSIFIGNVKNQDVRMDVYKSIKNQLRCKPVSVICFQEQFNYEIKSKPSKSSIVEILKYQNEIQFYIKTFTQNENGISITNKNTEINDETKDIHVERWKEENITDLTSNVAIQNITEYIEIMRDVLNLKNSDEFSKIIEDLVMRCSKQKTKKAVMFENSSVLVDNASLFAYFHCKKETEGFVTLAYAINIMSVEFKHEHFEIEAKEKQKYQKQEAFKHLKYLGIEL